MRVGGTLIGIVTIVLVLIAAFAAVQYDNYLDEKRMGTISHLVTLQPEAECRYQDASLCPQAQNHISLPNPTALAAMLLAVLLGIFVVRQDLTQRRILKELERKRHHHEKDFRFQSLSHFLNKEELQILTAVRQQQGITQATLKLRVDMSKAKLSAVLKELENRGIIKREPDGRTNKIFLKGDF